jgi:hypothetical protein
MIEYRFKIPSASVFTLYSYSKALEYRTLYLDFKALEYRFRVPTAASEVMRSRKHPGWRRILSRLSSSA